MDVAVMLMVLSAAFCHAAWNAVIKSGGDKTLSLAGMQAGIVLIALPLAPIVGLPHKESLPYLLVSVALHFGYYLSLARAYHNGDFAQVYPLARGGAPIIVAVWGLLVLRETMTGQQLIALGALIGGVLILAVARGRATSLPANRKALIGALLTAGFIGAYTIIDGLGGRIAAEFGGGVSAYVVWLCILDGAPITWYALRTRTLNEVRALAKTWHLSLFGAAMSLASYWLVVYAMSRAPIAVVAAVRETSIIIAALIGVLYFKEPAGARRVIAAIFIVIGIGLLGWN